MLLSLLGCLFTLQRTVWLATVVAVLAAMLWNRRLRVWVVPTVISGALVAGLALVVIPGLHQSASSRLNDQWTVWDRMTRDPFHHFYAGGAPATRIRVESILRQGGPVPDPARDLPVDRAR